MNDAGGHRENGCLVIHFWAQLATQCQTGEAQQVWEQLPARREWLVGRGGDSRQQLYRGRLTLVGVLECLCVSISRGFSGGERGFAGRRRPLGLALGLGVRARGAIQIWPEPSDSVVFMLLNIKRKTN